MASSDDEEVVVPQSVANFHFVDKDGVPISFSSLPIIMNDEIPETPKHQVSVRGTTDGGLQSVFKDVVAWKLRLDGDDPEVSVLSKDNKWLKLEKPKKSYEECIKTTLVIMYLLHFSKKNPKASVKNFWEHLRQISSSFNEKPRMDEFKHLMEIIKMFLENDTILAKSQILLTFVKNPGEAFTEDFQNNLGERPFFIDDEFENVGIDDGEDSEEESDLFDSVCSICDNGGELLCCEGRCLRSFHATKRAGSDSDCASLGLTRVQVEAMQNFLCKNCQFKKHQCFACGKLGSSDKSANAEVFSCVSATCGRFYHPKCVADLVFPENKIEAIELGKRIADGESFTCSVHRCCVCKKVENKEVEELQFAICRRCPKAYHRKCLPRKIAFEDDEDESIIQRAWEGLLPNRILIYCLKHEIDEELGTPYRDHIIFPELPEKKREMDIQKLKLKKIVPASGKITGNLQTSKPTNRLEKLPTADSDDCVLTGGKTSTQKVLNNQVKLNVPAKDVKPAVKKIESKEFPKASLSKVAKPNFDSEKSISGKAKAANSAAAVLGKLINTVPKILPEIKKEVHALVEQESSLLTQDDIRKRLLKPSTYGTSVGQIDKSITLGKIEGAIEAVRAALEKLEKGGNVEDAKAVCEPEILKRLIKWHVKLKVYLAPILHGARYSSYGRHFTKCDKLQEIVDKLQWYVQDDDMVVDFCCGANEFSILMKEKLDAAGKKCFFKNYDILQAKNGFNFEMRDWMTVRPNELPSGSKLIMGLNPPFGLNARLANQFIDKALSFKPKLLVLIVPQETRRLDTKNPQYDLIWEDRGTLSGKSFYLPGSIDVYDKQIEQWNTKPPPLYLWSRPDWTQKHKIIAADQGHTSRISSVHVPADSQVNGNSEDSPPPVTASIKNSRERDSAAHEERESEKAEARIHSERRDEAKLEAADDKKRPENKETAEVRIQAEKRIEAKREASVDKNRPENKETAEVRIQAEKREEAKREASDDKKRPENKEAAAAPPQNESTGEAHSKKPRLEESSKTGPAQAGKEAGKITAVAEHQSKKRKSSEPTKDSSNNYKKISGEQKLQQKQERGNESVELPSMSISPPDRRNSPHNNEVQKSPFGRESSHNVALPYAGPDGIYRRYFSTNSAAERDGMYANSSSPLRRSGAEFYGRDYPSDDRFRGYSSSMDAYNQSSSPFARSGYRTSPDASLRMPQFRNYSLPGGDGYGLLHNRNYGVPEEHTIGSRYPSSLGQQPGLYPLPSTYRLSGSAEASAMDRYAPRLDEMGLHSRPPSIPLHGSIRHGDIPPDSFGFTSAPPPFPKPGSFGGWIDD